jgi:hypothetical protein
MVAVKQWRFEFQIVKRPGGRYAWLLVGNSGDRCRVLACSARDYRRKKKVDRTIARIKKVVGDACVIDATGFELPRTSFVFAPDVTPLPVRPVEQGHVGGRRRRRAGHSSPTDASAAGAKDGASTSPETETTSEAAAAAAVITPSKATVEPTSAPTQTNTEGDEPASPQ